MRADIPQPLLTEEAHFQRLSIFSFYNLTVTLVEPDPTEFTSLNGLKISETNAISSS